MWQIFGVLKNITFKVKIHLRIFGQISLKLATFNSASGQIASWSLPIEI